MEIEKRNIFPQDTKETLPYISRGTLGKHAYPVRENPEQHAQYIERRLQECQREALSQGQVAAVRLKEGLYLEFSGAAAKELNVRSLENISQGIRLLNVQNTNSVTKATVFVPAGRESFFLKRAKEYKESIDKIEKPKHNDLIRSIEDVRLAVIQSFWIGDKADIPGANEVWCEVWLRFNRKDCKKAEEDFQETCRQASIEYKSQRIHFPERIVYMIKANEEKLNALILGCSYIAEFRRAPEAVSFFYKLSGAEQSEWEKELLERTIFEGANATVCLLDTGLTGAHPLIEPAVVPNGVQSVEESWGTDDHHGHGTEMAGVAVYYDLKKCLAETRTVEVLHRIESVKILPPRGNNDPELYGAITEQAAALAELENPNANRSLCMAVTAPTYTTSDGSPSSWSGSIDNLTAGVDNDGNSKRLMFISAGNVDPRELNYSEYPYANYLHGVENPGQSWNALTVGAYNKDIEIYSSDFSGFTPVADVGELSPYSSTSVSWDNKWPVKPEILLDGGNVATNGADYTECPDYSLLTTNKDFLTRPFSVIWATSAATAQAAWMAAQIFAEYPDMWPETVRGLLVHSARWTEKMVRQFCFNEKRQAGGRKNLLRACGYGIPDLNRAIQCMNNSVNMIIQGELQPFKKENGRYTMNEMDLHTLPWPKEVLAELGDTETELRVTLSYFIEPGPGEIGWKDKYRYQSCGLRFDVRNTNETEEDFKKRVNVKVRGEDKRDKGEGSSGSNRWYLGSKLRDVGSVHSDFMRLSGAELSDINQIAVYPVIGWWRERAYLDKYNSKIRYALIVSISTPKQDIDFYTPIITQIENKIEVPVTIG